MQKKWRLLGVEWPLPPGGSRVGRDYEKTRPFTWKKILHHKLEQKCWIYRGVLYCVSCKLFREIKPLKSRGSIRPSLPLPPVEIRWECDFEKTILSMQKKLLHHKLDKKWWIYRGVLWCVPWKISREIRGIKSCGSIRPPPPVEIGLSHHQSLFKFSMRILVNISMQIDVDFDIRI